MTNFLTTRRNFGIFLGATVSCIIVVGTILSLPANIPQLNFTIAECVIVAYLAIIGGYFGFYYGYWNRRKRPMLPPFPTNADKKEATTKEATFLRVNGEVKGLKVTDNKMIGSFDKATMIDIGKGARVTDTEAKGNVIENTDAEGKKARRSTDKEKD